VLRPVSTSRNPTKFQSVEVSRNRQRLQGMV
jgi:hypothetical protein